jgi:amidohydrolase
MVKEGVLENPKVEAIFDCTLTLKPKQQNKIPFTYGGSDWFTIKNKWKTNAWRYPWLGIDPIATAAQIIMEFKLLLAEI